MTHFYSDSMKMPLHFPGFPILPVTSQGNFGKSEYKDTQVEELLELLQRMKEITCTLHPNILRVFQWL